MHFRPFLLLSIAAIAALAQSDDDSSRSTTSHRSTSHQRTATSTGIYDLPFTLSGSVSIITPESVSAPTGRYLSYTRQVEQPTGTLSGNGTRRGNSTATTGNSLYLVGTLLPNATTTQTGSGTSSVRPTNTQPCNGYPEFCNRKYSNITEVCAHNSAFVRKNNAAANQAVSIPGQLNDGIRMIQGETHYVNGSLWSCHTSCSLLNAGTLEAELTTVRQWLDAHPYDVVTILLVNSDYVSVDKYRAPLENSGIADYAYIPPKVPMFRDDWPTLSSMILRGTRAVVFMDYNANQTEIPYILDEFSQMWETPFSPTDPELPCTAQRPPGISQAQAEDMLYIANHNLDVELKLAGLELLIPNYANLTALNAVNGSLSLGKMARECKSNWGKPPNFLLVDFYNVGNGSVFEVAAKMNNVTYKGNCCGTDTAISGGMSTMTTRLVPTLALALLTACLLL